jgi:hypothetical protein
VKVAWCGALVLLVTTAGRADDPSRPPLLFDLTHQHPEIMVETTLASVTYNDAALQGTTYVQVERLAFEMPIVPARWYVGAGYDAAIGHDDDGSPRFVSGNPELWGRGVWTAAYGLSFGGGFAFVIPTSGSPLSNAAATTAYAALAARGWDRALLIDPNDATLRPFLDVRLVTGPVTVCYRQSLEITTNFGAPAFQLAAVGTVYFAVRFSPLLSAGIDLVEYYNLASGVPDDQRGYFAVGAHVAFDMRYFRPAIGLMTNIGSPLDTISQIGSPLATTSATFVGVHFSLDFPIHKKGQK